MAILTGRNTNDTLKGTNSADTLKGLGGADVLRGMGGNDLIDGGAGNDQLTGDAGTDTFDYNAVSDSGASAGQWSAATGDTITDFARGDKIDLRDLAKTGTGAPDMVQWQGLNPTAPMAYGAWYKQSGGNTYVYADTTGDKVADLAIKVAGSVAFQATDFLGVNRSPTAVGESVSVEDDKTLSGSLALNDTDPDGHARSYALVTTAAPAPAGLTIKADGTYTFDATSYASLAAGQTKDLSAQYQVSDGHGGTATATLAIKVVGTNDAPVVSGAVTGAATEDGAADPLHALANASDVDAGTTLSVVDVPAEGELPSGVSYEAGTKTFTLDPSHADYQDLGEGETATVTVEYGVSDGTVTTLASVSWTVTGAADGPVRNVINGTEGNDWLGGSEADEAFNGYGGDDTIYVGYGVDEVDAGDGDDSVLFYDLTSGDWADGGNGNDFLGVTGSIDGIWNNAGITDPLLLEGGNLYLGDVQVATGFERFQIYGGSGDDDLTGGAEYDFLSAGSGTDQIFAGGGNDEVMFDDLNSGDVADGGDGLSDRLETVGGAGDDVFTSANGGVTLNGVQVGSGFEVFGFRAGAGNDTVTGGAGRDYLDGGDGDDILTGGAGDDGLSDGAGADQMYAGEGDDSVYLSDLTDGSWADGGAGTDNLDLDASSISGTLVLKDDILSLNDVEIATGFESYSIYGTSGDDDLAGGAGYAYFWGGDGDDTLTGGAGDGRLNGGAGSDLMTGGQGADEFMFSDQENTGTDTITDFESGIDTLDFEEGRIRQQQQIDIGGDNVMDLRLTLANGGTVDLLGISALGPDDVDYDW